MMDLGTAASGSWMMIRAIPHPSEAETQRKERNQLVLDRPGQTTAPLPKTKGI